jgi:HSP20 family protein
MISLKIVPYTNRSSNLAPDSATYYLVNLNSGNRPRYWRPPTDVYETEDHLIIRVEIAGMTENDFSINVDQNRLVITGIRSDTGERRAFHQMEIPFGEFVIDVELHVPIDVDRGVAQYLDGFLVISLPKLQPRHISITNKES